MSGDARFIVQEMPGGELPGEDNVWIHFNVSVPAAAGGEYKYRISVRITDYLMLPNAEREAAIADAGKRIGDAVNAREAAVSP